MLCVSKYPRFKILLLTVLLSVLCSPNAAAIPPTGAPSFCPERESWISIHWLPPGHQSPRSLPLIAELPGSPFRFLKDILDNIGQRRARAGQKHDVFLIVRRETGYFVWQFEDPRGATVDLSEILPEDLPLGGDPMHPESWIVDGRGRLGRVVLTGLKYQIKELGTSPQGDLVPADSTAEPLRVRSQTKYKFSEKPRASRYDLRGVVPQNLSNAEENVAWGVSHAFRPGYALEDSLAILKWVRQNGGQQIVKAGGSRHSWSRIGALDDETSSQGRSATGGIFIYPDEMTGIRPLWQDGQPAPLLRRSLSEEVVRNLFRIGSGTTICEANEVLWNHYGKAIVALGGYDGQTFGGVFPTGTHGSAFKQGALTKMIESIDLIASTGKIYRIEPANGITDPEVFLQARPDWYLIQSNDHFNAAVVHLGALGIVHSYVIKTADKFYLKEVRTNISVTEVRRVLADGNIYHHFGDETPPAWVKKDKGRRFEGHPKSAFHLEILINPHTDRALVTTRQPTTLGRPEPASFARRPEKHLLRALLTPNRYGRPDFSTWLTEHYPTWISNFAVWVYKKRPKWSPKVTNFSVSALADKRYINRSYRVFNIGDGQNNLPNLTSSIFVPLKDDKYLDAIEIIQETARKAASDGRYQTGPVAIRFVKGAPLQMLPSHDFASFELIFAARRPWDPNLHDEYAYLLHQYYTNLKKDLGTAVIFHWGQHIEGMTPKDVANFYPELEDWKEIRQSYDPTGRFLTRWLAHYLSISK